MSSDKPIGDPSTRPEMEIPGNASQEIKNMVYRFVTYSRLRNRQVLFAGEIASHMELEEVSLVDKPDSVDGLQGKVVVGLMVTESEFFRFAHHVYRR